MATSGRYGGRDDGRRGDGRRDYDRCDGWRSRRWLAGMMARRNDAVAMMAAYSLATIGIFRRIEKLMHVRVLPTKFDSDIDAPDRR